MSVAVVIQCPQGEAKYNGLRMSASSTRPCPASSWISPPHGNSFGSCEER